MSHFLEKYNVTGIVDNEPLDGMFLQANTGKNRFLYNLILQHGGKIFDNGLFKIHTFKYVEKWTALLAEYFKEEIKAFNVICFASNWQGIMYCVDKNNKTITYFDPATCEYFSADASLEQFFGEILVDGEYDILFEGYFNEARDFMKLETFDYECSIGHKKYLHLGGNDNVDNLEIVNTDVLWNLQIQTAESLNEIDNK